MFSQASSDPTKIPQEVIQQHNLFLVKCKLLRNALLIHLSTSALAIYTVP